MSYESCGILILNILGIWGGKPKMEFRNHKKGSTVSGKAEDPGFSLHHNTAFRLLLMVLLYPQVIMKIQTVGGIDQMVNLHVMQR